MRAAGKFDNHTNWFDLLDVRKYLKRLSNIFFSKNDLTIYVHVQCTYVNEIRNTYYENRIKSSN